MPGSVNSAQVDSFRDGSKLNAPSDRTTTQNVIRRSSFPKYARLAAQVNPCRQELSRWPRRTPAAWVARGRVQFVAEKEVLCDDTHPKDARRTRTPQLRWNNHSHVSAIRRAVARIRPKEARSSRPGRHAPLPGASASRTRSLPSARSRPAEGQVSSRLWEDPASAASLNTRKARWPCRLRDPSTRWTPGSVRGRSRPPERTAPGLSKLKRTSSLASSTETPALLKTASTRRNAAPSSFTRKSTSASMSKRTLAPAGRPADWCWKSPIESRII